MTSIHIRGIERDRFTAAAVRVLASAGRLAATRNHLAVDAAHVLWALLEDESKAAALLVDLGLETEAANALLVQLPTAGYAPQYVLDPIEPPESEDLKLVMLEAIRFARLGGPSTDVGTEHLLFGLAVIETPVSEVLHVHDLDERRATELARRAEAPVGEPLAVDIEFQFDEIAVNDESMSDVGSPELEPRSPIEMNPERTDDGRSDHVVEFDNGHPNVESILPERFTPIQDPTSDPTSLRHCDSVHDETAPGDREFVEAGRPESKLSVDVSDCTGFSPVTENRHEGQWTDLHRVVDAAANRAREGLRVAEDYVRFLRDDRHLVGLLKSMRHDLTGILAGFDEAALLRARDTTADVGTTVSTVAEGRRDDPVDVLRAALRRSQEALRSLEEFGKVLVPESGAAFEALRYRLYTIEKAALVTSAATLSLADRRLYLLLTRETCRHDPEHVVRRSVEGGVSIVQVREKTLADRELVEWCRRVRRWTQEAGALLIVNDRPDVAVLCDADGVHVGQDELTVRQARRIVGPYRLVGVSTHDLSQARRAVEEGADYIGVGPTFHSGTKYFVDFAGVELAGAVAREISRPAFAIGGIDARNVREVVAAGGTRIAVTAAVCSAEDPAAAAAELVAALVPVGAE